MPRRDLSLDEQKNARAYLQRLSAMNDILQARVEVSVTIAFRIAKMLDVSLHPVFMGTELGADTCTHAAQ